MRFLLAFALLSVFSLNTIPAYGVTDKPLPRDVPVYPAMEEIDLMLMDGRMHAVIDLLGEYWEDPPAGVPRFEISWRMAQAYQFAGDDLMFRDGDTDAIAELFDQSEYWVEKTLELAPDEHHGYFWEAALLGQRGLLRGPLNSLFAAGDMRGLLEYAAQLEPYAGHVYYTASLLYHQLPRTISFGDRDTAVSLARAGVAYQRIMVAFRAVVKETLNFRIQLARTLWTRNWSRARRLREQAEKREELSDLEHPFERAKRYEGRFSIPPISDRQEARQILDRVEEILTDPERTPEPTDDEELDWADERDLHRVRELREEWGS